MKRCKKCKKPITLGLEDLMSGKEFEQPACVSTESVKAGMCKECFQASKK